MELVEGPTLAEKISDAAAAAGGPGMPLDRALPIARQLAEALEAAHESGIVHRDLKPENIKVTSSGTVKVLDFGLAKTVGDSSKGPDALQAPTVTIEGVVVGTVAYMSPEQARGLPVDKRTDVWAFGCVLYEMLSGRKPFPGQTQSDVMASVLQRSPEWDALPAGLPGPVLRLLHRCLEKDPKLRLRDMGDAQLDLEDASKAPVPELAEKSPRQFSWVPWVAAGLLLMSAAAAWLILYRRPPQNPLANAHFTRLTDWEGVERDAANARRQVCGLCL